MFSLELKINDRNESKIIFSHFNYKFTIHLLKHNLILVISCFWLVSGKAQA